MRRWGRLKKEWKEEERKILPQQQNQIIRSGGNPIKEIKSKIQ